MTESYIAGNGNGGKRIVTLDMETIGLDPSDPDAALGRGNKNAAPGEMCQIVCIGLIIEEGGSLTEKVIANRDERKLLIEFWGVVRPEDIFWGFNLREFDLLKIMQRSWILGVRPTINFNMAKYRETNVVDWMERWTNWSNPLGCKLDYIARALGVGRKSGHGGDVEELWRTGQYAAIMDYCLADTRLHYLIGCRMSYREPLPFAMPAPEPARPVTIPAAREAVAVRVSPVRNPRETPRPISELLNYAEGRVEEGAPDGRYRFISDGRGGMVRVANEPSSSAPAAAKPVEGFSRAATAAPAASSGRPRAKKVYYAEDGAETVLTGGTFLIKEELKAIGAKPSDIETPTGKKFSWRIPAARFDALAGLCARAGLVLARAA